MAISFTRFRTQTMMIAFTTLLTDANVTLYGEAAAFAVLGFLPVLIIAFLFLRKYLVSGYFRHSVAQQSIHRPYEASWQ